MNHTYFLRLQDIMKEREVHPPLAIAERLKELKNKQILLYGAGAFGQENYSFLTRYGIEPVAFLDRNAKDGSKKMGIPVYPPDDSILDEAFRKSCIVLIAITLPKNKMNSIKNDLFNWGYANYREAQKLLAMQVGYDDIIELDPDKKYFEKNEEKIYKVLQMMSDDESCETYLSCLRAHLLRNYSSCVETDFPVQYFDAGVPCKKGFSYFIDCGAYTGDSLEAAMQHSENITGYVAFEPIPSNFLNLSKNINKLSDKITNSYLFPCGVSEKTGSIRFINSASSSSISQSGDGEILPIVSIDDALKKFPVTFLKMDIEGAEIMALRGGKNLITEYRPDLAISAYHFVNHYWDIPCLIHEIHPNYDFYLRSHSPATLETVLYAVEK